MALELTPRQVEVCVLAGSVVAWMSEKAIGRELDITRHTVKVHMRDGARRIVSAHPELDCGSPRRICQAWVRASYHAINARAASRAA